MKRKIAEVDTELSINAILAKATAARVAELYQILISAPDLQSICRYEETQCCGDTDEIQQYDSLATSRFTYNSTTLWSIYLDMSESLDAAAVCKLIRKIQSELSPMITCQDRWVFVSILDRATMDAGVDEIIFYISLGNTFPDFDVAYMVLRHICARVINGSFTTNFPQCRRLEPDRRLTINDLYQIISRIKHSPSIRDIVSCLYKEATESELNDILGLLVKVWPNIASDTRVDNLFMHCYQNYREPIEALRFYKPSRYYLPVILFETYGRALSAETLRHYVKIMCATHADFSADILHTYLHIIGHFKAIPLHPLDGEPHLMIDNAPEYLLPVALPEAIRNYSRRVADDPIRSRGSRFMYYEGLPKTSRRVSDDPVHVRGPSYYPDIEEFMYRLKDYEAFFSPSLDALYNVLEAALASY